MNERKTIASVIRQARLVHRATEVIVVVNGSYDETERIARQMGARVISFKESLGHDVPEALAQVMRKGAPSCSLMRIW